jgi:hypothetical protein
MPMASTLRRRLPTATVALLIATAACSTDRAGRATLMQASGSAPARITLRLAPGQSSASLMSPGSRPMAADRDSGDAGDSAGQPAFARVDTSDVDSLIVNVTQVQIRGNAGSDDGHGNGQHPDSAGADSGRGNGGHGGSNADSGRGDGGRDGSNADSGRSSEIRRGFAADHGESGGGPDSARGRDDNEGRDGWITLSVTGNGHLNLLSLPTSADSGLVVATDSVPPGTYEHLRLFVTNPMIFFRKDIVTPAGDTLKAGTGYPVFIPSADSTGAAMRTDEPFVIPTGGGNVPVFFDKDDTIRRIVITGNGRIVVPPVIR